MLVQRAYKTELDLSNRQVTACKRRAGAARRAYNWGLRVKQERYPANQKSPHAATLHRQIKNQRRNTLHQVTTRLAKTKSVLWSCQRWHEA
jgi:Helix-turn-helix domain